MHRQLVTSAELEPTSLSLWRVIRTAAAWALLAGVSAFLLTWLILAWPTVVAELSWTTQHVAGTDIATLSAASQPVVADNHLAIPAIHVDAPVFYDTTITDAVGKLPDGVVHVQGTAEPGAVGNVFIVGHSSGYWWQAGQYTQVFVLLDKLQNGDTILINHNGTTSTYRVTSHEVVPPTAVDELKQPTDRRELSLMTCSPVGTSLNRLIVHAEFIKN